MNTPFAGIKGILDGLIELKSLFLPSYVLNALSIAAIGLNAILTYGVSPVSLTALSLREPLVHGE